jgi:thiamine monophosphate kinase
VSKNKSRDALRLQAQISGMSGKSLQSIQSAVSDNMSAKAKREAVKSALDMASGLNDELDRHDFSALTGAIDQLLNKINQAVFDGDLRGAAFATNSLTAIMKQRDAIGARIAQRDAIAATKVAHGDDWGIVLGALEQRLNNEENSGKDDPSSGNI